MGEWLQTLEDGEADEIELFSKLMSRWDLVCFLLPDSLGTLRLDCPFLAVSEVMLESQLSTPHSGATLFFFLFFLPALDSAG
jgi:hypothetical protein